MTQPVDLREDGSKVEFAADRLVAARNVGNLDMTDERQEMAQAVDDPATDHLPMIEVELRAQGRCPDCRDPLCREIIVADEIVRQIVLAERLNQHGDAGHDMQAFGAGESGIGQRRENRLAEYIRLLRRDSGGHG